MKQIVPVPVFLLAFLLFLISCNNQDSTMKEKGNDDNIVITSLVEEWNKAHSSKDIGKLSILYDSSILYYGTPKGRNECIQDKLSYFNKFPDYYQQLFGALQIERVTVNDIKCSFVKRATVNKVSNDYPSYLIFTKKEDKWLITTEGDLVTDKNIANAKAVQIPNDALKGDFNGDGVLDFAWIAAPKVNGTGEDCAGGCICYIKFSDPKIPSIKVENCISGSPDNLSDLNKNGTDEIGILPGWFTSCWHAYNVYTFKNGRWIFAVDPISTHCNQWDQGIKPIEIDYNKDGNVLIRYSDYSNDDIVTKTKSVLIVR